jgi:hypothetical protein
MNGNAFSLGIPNSTRPPPAIAVEHDINAAFRPLRHAEINNNRAVLFGHEKTRGSDSDDCKP